jgi:SAM-dependent methyltransferase
VDAPLPPIELAERVGFLTPELAEQVDGLVPLLERTGWWHPDDAMLTYDLQGRALRDDLVALLPDDWSWEGRRALDFGCGAGRILRHLLDEAEIAELHGVDIDEPSIAWLRANLQPPLHVATNAESPPLPFPDGHFDLIWALSVFTHITDRWSEWLLELRRVLKADGLLIASFHGAGSDYGLAAMPWHEGWDADRIGMHVSSLGASWAAGGPTVFHSPWWLRAHWGRAFEVVDLREGGLAMPDETGHGTVVLRKRDGELSREDLERDEPGEQARELEARRYNLRQLQSEARWNDLHLTEFRRQRDELERTRSQLEGLIADLRARIGVYETSRSWRLTRPLRGAAKLVRRRRGDRSGRTG